MSSSSQSNCFFRKWSHSNLTLKSPKDGPRCTVSNRCVNRETWPKNALKKTRQTLMMQPGPFLSAKENDDAFPISKTPPPKKKKLRSFHEFHVISALSDVKQLKLLATGRCWPPASRPCFRLKRSDGEKRGSDGRSSSWVVISWSRKMTPNFSLKICWEQKSLDQYVKHFLVFQK